MVFFRRLDRKGQESAPFELLIAVIVMGFVIIMGLNAIFVLQRESCEGDIEKQLENIKSALEIVARGEGNQTISYLMPSCFNEEESNLEIIERDDPQTCSFYCGGNSYNCILLSFSSPDYHSLKCLKMSNAVTFPPRNTSASPEICNILPGQDDPDLSSGEPYFDTIDWREGAIPQGFYTLIKEINLYTSQPMICAYLRADTRQSSDSGES